MVNLGRTKSWTIHLICTVLYLPEIKYTILFQLVYMRMQPCKLLFAAPATNRMTVTLSACEAFTSAHNLGGVKGRVYSLLRCTANQICGQQVSSAKIDQRSDNPIDSILLTYLPLVNGTGKKLTK